MKRLMMLALLVGTLGLTVGCGENSPLKVSQPSVGTEKKLPAPTLPEPGVGTPTEPPDAHAGWNRYDYGYWREEGCTAPCVVKYYVTVLPAPEVMDFIFASFHNDSLDNAPTTDRPNNSLRIVEGKSHFDAGDGGVTVFGYDTRDHNCGRVQNDVSMVTRKANVDHLVFGAAYFYPIACGPGVPPVPPVPPTPPVPPIVPPVPPVPPVCTVGCEPVPPPCTDPSCQRVAQPKWQSDAYCGNFGFTELNAGNFGEASERVLSSDGTDDSQEPMFSTIHRTSCEGRAVRVEVKEQTAFVTVSEVPVTLSFVMYRKNGVSVLPQKYEDGVLQTFTVPGDYVMTVRKVVN